MKLVGVGGFQVYYENHYYHKTGHCSKWIHETIFVPLTSIMVEILYQLKK